MTNEVTGASERHEYRGAVGSPVQRHVRPDPERDGGPVWVEADAMVMLLERAASMLTGYGELIRRDGASHAEEHHYLPEVEHVAAELRTLTAELGERRERAAALEDRLREIGDFAHDHSTGPAVPDALWEVRAMAYEA